MGNVLGRRLLLLLCCTSISEATALVQAANVKIDVQRCMGKWFVQRAIPAVAPLEKDAHNGCEHYTWDSANSRIDVTYKFNAGSFDGPMRQVKQRCWVQTDQGTTWAVSPQIGGFGLPIKLPFLITDIDDVDYSYLVCSGGAGSWMYVLTRDKQPDDALMSRLEKTVQAAGFDMSAVLTMPHA